MSKELLHNASYAKQIHKTGQFYLSAKDFNKQDISTLKRLTGRNTSNLSIEDEKDVNAEILASIREDVSGQTIAAIIVNDYLERVKIN